MDNPEWSEMDPEVVQFDVDVDSVCNVCHGEDYQHDEDCAIGGESMLDEEYEYGIEDCE
jgi:hypothetical protein